MIDRALQRTKEWLGVEGNIEWKKEYYQCANRLAFLYFFREVIKKPAWLINIYFLNDIKNNPTTQEQWDIALAEIKADFGLKRKSILKDTEIDPLSYSLEIFLPARDRSELS